MSWNRHYPLYGEYKNCRTCPKRNSCEDIERVGEHLGREVAMDYLSARHVLDFIEETVTTFSDIPASILS